MDHLEPGNRWIDEKLPPTHTLFSALSSDQIGPDNWCETSPAPNPKVEDQATDATDKKLVSPLRQSLHIKQGQVDGMKLVLIHLPQ